MFSIIVVVVVVVYHRIIGVGGEEVMAVAAGREDLNVPRNRTLITLSLFSMFKYLEDSRMEIHLWSVH